MDRSKTATSATRGETESPRVAYVAVFERIFDACASSFYRYFAVRAGDAHLADDLMQQLWLQARGKAAGIRKPISSIGWRSPQSAATHWRVKARRPGHQPMPDPDLAASLADRLVSEAIAPHELERREWRTAHAGDHRAAGGRAGADCRVLL